MRLATRLTLVLLIPIAVCFAMRGYVSWRLRRDAQLDEASREVRDHGVTLKVALDAFLREHSLRDLAQLTEDLSRADRVLGVLVFDDADRPVAASRSVLSYRDAFRSLAAAARTRNAPRTEIRDNPGGDLYAYAFPIAGEDSGTPRGSAVLLRQLDYVNRNMRAYAREQALVALLVMLIVALGTWLVVRATVSRPVARLVGGFEAVAAGSLETAVAIRSGDEIGRLADAFNRMTSSLREAQDELETTTAANVALERRLQHVQRLALVGQMAASVAHEIGSPLNVILGRARYATKQTCNEARHQRHFEEIVAGAERISHVIEQLLVRSRRARAPAERVSLGSVARGMVRFLEAELDRARVVPRIRIEDDVAVDGRRDELEQVVLNLCMNALHAQPRGGWIEIRVRRGGAGSGRAFAEMIVSDGGPGVPEAIRSRVFEPFFTTKGATDGTGLGLAICDEIVRRHGGTITLDQREGRGAAFVVTLPLLSTGARALGTAEAQE